MLGVPPERVFEALQVYLGSAYVNDFNLLGRTYPRDRPGRRASSATTPRDIAQLKTRSNSGAMVPIGSVATFQDKTGPVPRHALQPLPRGRGRRRDRARATSTGQSLATMEKLAAEPAGGLRHRMDRHRLPAESGRQHRRRSIFALAVVFVFLVLAAQFESLLLPLAIILIVPMTLLAAMAGVNLRGHGQQHPDPDRPDRADRARREECDPDRRVRQAGGGAWAAARSRRRSKRRASRLRPILMTSFAFILGVAAAGDRERRRAGSFARRSAPRSSSA